MSQNRTFFGKLAAGWPAQNDRREILGLQPIFEQFLASRLGLATLYAIQLGWPKWSLFFFFFWIFFRFVLWKLKPKILISEKKNFEFFRVPFKFLIKNPFWFNLISRILSQSTIKKKKIFFLRIFFYLFENWNQRFWFALKKNFWIFPRPFQIETPANWRKVDTKIGRKKQNLKIIQIQIKV